MLRASSALIPCVQCQDPHGHGDGAVDRLQSLAPPTGTNGNGRRLTSPP
jgi:hypothetical protein